MASLLDQQQELLRNRLLGRSVACPPILPGVDIGRDLVMAQGPSGLDLVPTTGIDALGQALQIALTTALGSDIFNTDFGFDGINALVEETNAVMARERVRISVIQVLRKDPRVRGILDLKLLDGRLDPLNAGEVAPANEPLEARIERWRSVNVNVAFETISADQATISLGKVVPGA
jgi:phage baseplate assembly protein W